MSTMTARPSNTYYDLSYQWVDSTSEPDELDLDINFSTSKVTELCAVSEYEDQVEAHINHIINKNFTATIERLKSLSQDEDDDERPTSYALSRAFMMIYKAFNCADFPRATVSSDGQGGLRLYWKKGNCLLELAIPSNNAGREYIYVRDLNYHELIEQVTPMILSQKLYDFNTP